MTLATPQSLLREHHKLHDDIARAAHLPGAIGAAAERVGRILESHVRKEEAYALPPLGMIADALKPAPGPDAREAVILAGELQAHLADMLAEHRMIVAALEEFISVARQADGVEYADMALQLMAHIRLEEEVLYPAALMLGQYLKLKLKLG